jgi:hypothetical protein
MQRHVELGVGFRRRDRNGGRGSLRLLACGWFRGRGLAGETGPAREAGRLTQPRQGRLRRPCASEPRGERR